jgi:mannosyltransferase
VVTQPRRIPLARTLLLLSIIVLAFALRLGRLDSQSFWADEAISAFSASVPAPLFFSGLPPDQSPAYYFLLQNWIRVAGDVDYTIRFLSVFFGTLGVVLVYVLGRRLFSTRVGYVASFLAAINPFAVYYSQEARPYSLVLACAPAALYWFARAYAQPGNRRLWAAHAVALAAALYTHYYAFALPLAEWLWLVLERAGRTRAMLIRLFFSTAGAGILYLPWLPLMLRVFIP